MPLPFVVVTRLTFQLCACALASGCTRPTDESSTEQKEGAGFRYCEVEEVGITAAIVDLDVKATRTAAGESRHASSVREGVFNI